MILDLLERLKELENKYRLRYLMGKENIFIAYLIYLKYLCDQNVYDYEEVFMNENLYEITYDIQYLNHWLKEDKLPIHTVLRNYRDIDIKELIMDFIQYMEKPISFHKENDSVLYLNFNTTNIYSYYNLLGNGIYVMNSTYQNNFNVFKMFDEVLEIHNQYIIEDEFHLFKESYDYIYFYSVLPRYKISHTYNEYFFMKKYIQKTKYFVLYTKYSLISNFSKGISIAKYIKMILLEENKATILFDKLQDPENSEISIIQYHKDKIKDSDYLKKVIQNNRKLKDILVKTNYKELLNNNLRIGFKLYQLQKNDDGAFYSVETGKVLFTVKNGGIVTVSEDVTPYDNICYIITDEDREALSNPFFLEDCDAIVVNFVPGSGSGGNTDLLTYEGTLKSGMNLYAQENKQLSLAIDALVATDYLTEFLNSGHSGPKYEEEMSLMYFLTETNKHLFSVSPEGIVTLSDELSAADDISYVITEADRTIFEEKGYAEDLAPYGTIKIHFGTGGDGTQPTGIELNKSTLRFTSVGQAHHLIATVYPSDATQSVTWKSDNTQVAIVDEKGLITVTGFGETTIHASTANNLVADCQVSVKQFIGGDLGTQGTWRFEDGVLTVDYNGQMPWNCTSKTTDPEVAYRLKWIDLLSQIKEIVITGKDVEIQPYFLFYSGDGDLGQHPDDHVRTLTLGSGVKKVGKQALTLYDLKRVNVYSIDPPVLASDLGESNCFWKKRIEDNLAFLYLPANAGIGYAMMSSEWAFFNHSTNHLDMADNPVGINEMKSEDSSTKSMKNEGAWYTLDGRQVVNGKLPRGIYINNGKKVVVK